VSFAFHHEEHEEHKELICKAAIPGICGGPKQVLSIYSRGEHSTAKDAKQRKENNSGNENLGVLGGLSSWTSQ
jgi:hypothetical protein